MKDKPSGALLLLEAHGCDHGGHSVDLGTRARYFPTFRLFSMISNARDGRPFDCIISSCQAGVTHDDISAVLPENSMFVTMAQGAEKPLCMSFNTLLRVAINNPLTSDWLSADRLLLSHLAREEKEYKGWKTTLPQITITGTDFDADDITRSCIGRPMGEKQKAVVDKLLTRSGLREPLPQLLAEMEAGVETVSKHRALAVALASRYEFPHSRPPTGSPVTG